jgi:hypothetical protein
MSKTIQEQILLNLNLKEGDRVKITHSVPDLDLGWRNGWVKAMDQAIGKEGKVISVDKMYGIFLEVEGLSSGYSYPPQCVELVSRAEELVDDRLPIGTKVEVLVNRPDGADLKKGDIVEILEYSGKHSYRLEGGWYVHKEYVRRATKPAKFPIGSRVRVLIDEPNAAGMKKDELGTIIDIYNDDVDYTSYKIRPDKNNHTWAISQKYLEVVTEPVADNKEKKESKYYTFTDELHNSISGISPLRVGKGIVEEEDRYKCLFVIGDEYEPIIENKGDLKLIRLVKTNKHS